MSQKEFTLKGDKKESLKNMLIHLSESIDFSLPIPEFEISQDRKKSKCELLLETKHHDMTF